MTHIPKFLRAALFAAPIALAACGMTPKADSTPMGSAGSVSFSATLSGAAEVPGNTSTASGRLDATLDKASNALRWTMTYSGLSGPATMAHFHGPAMPGANAGVAVPFPNATSPAAGETTLTPMQIDDLMAGKWYANVHTAAFPGGEIRGQMMRK
ncbi:MAG: CHRD domain-containing protein [Burkholderiales bacterium]